MMRNLKHIILSLLMISLAAVSCADLSEGLDESVHGGAIVLNFRTSGVAVKGTVEDNDCESYMSHLDVVIYKYYNTEYTPFHHERIYVSATPEGSVSLHKTKNDFEESATYKIYVIANSTLDESAFYKAGNRGGELLGHAEFLNLDQTDKLIHLSGVDHHIMNPHYPQMFLMDGVAYTGNKEPSSSGFVVVNNPANNDDVALNVVLRRAAAKIIVTIIPGDKVTFTPQLMAQSHGYLVRNMPNRTTLVADGGYPLNEQGARPYWESTTISQTPYFNLIQDEKGAVQGLQITAYCYSHKWEKEYVFEKGTSVVMMLPMKYKESEDKEIEYINNYYQLSITKNQQIKRNTLYDLRITLNAPGAEDITTPEEVDDIQYFTAPWETVDLPISGESTVKYLKVNKKKIYMYNIADDNSSLYFSSSSPVTVQLVSGSAYYYNKYSQKISLGTSVTNNIYASTESGAVSGNISVHSDIPTNNTIRYFQLKVTNEEGLSEIVDVEQYPLIYITNGLPWYSYRDDYYYRENQGHTFRDNVSSSTTNGNNPTTYQQTGDRIVSIYTIDKVDIYNKTATYTYSSAAPSNNHGWTCSKVRGDKASDGKRYAINYYYYDRWGSQKTSNCETHNVRNYHVRMMASSKDYTVGRPALDKYGYTDDSDDNAKLVSPSFVIASRLGAVLSTYSNLSGMSSKNKLVVFADHCKNYVEVDDVNDNKQNPVEVHDNWRLPTEAELKIIMDIQGGDGVDAQAIDFLLNGGYYMSASGPVFNPKNTSGVREANDKWSVSDVAIRCVRDAF